MAELTLEDIAKKVGVSRSTVSRVINRSPNVDPEVRKRVLEAIQATGYHPNMAARSLATQRSWMIGLVLPRSVTSFFTDPYFPQLTQGIAQACNVHDLSLSLFVVGNKEDEEKITPRISRRGMLDGILIQSGQPDDKLIEHLSLSSVPSVILGRPFHPDGKSYIDVDNIKAAETATRHLIDQGYQRIATITGSFSSTVSIDRLQGYKKAHTEAGRVVDPALIVESDFLELGGYTAMMKLLQNKPDAVFVQSDMMAIGAIHAVQDSGLQVPGDVAFVGFDDLPPTTSSDIKLTTIRQPILQFGISAVELLITRIENDSADPTQLILDTELIVRDSSGAREASRSSK